MSSGTLVKIGGACFTDKTRLEPAWHDQPGFGADFKSEVFAKVVSDLAMLPDLQGVVVGAGSFGHPAALKLGLRPDSFVDVECERLRANLTLLKGLVLPLLNPLGVPIYFAGLQEGADGVRVQSGDEIIVDKALAIQADRLIFYSDEPGTLNKVDVTGGEVGKLAQLSRLPVNVQVELRVVA